jgi:hypothetical protein
MTRRFGLLLACVASVGFGCGCKDDSPPPMDAGPGEDAEMGDAELDAGPRAECDREDGDRDAYFLVRRIAFDRDISINPSSGAISGEAVGFDLDGVDGVTCGQADFTWEGETGIDNNLALLLDLAGSLVDDLDVDALLAESIDAGDILILARVAAWNGQPNDDCVDVALLLGEVPPDGPQDVWICEGEGAGRTCEINEGLVLNIDRGSFDDMGRPQIGMNQQVISGGRLLTDPSTISLEIPFGDGVLALTLLDGQVRLDVDVDGMSNGILGGSLDVETFITLMLDLLGDAIPPAFQGVLVDVLRSLGDLHHSGGNCNALSVGMSVEGVAVEVAGVGLCQRNADCDDGNLCTINVCGADGSCRNYNQDLDVPCGGDRVCNGAGRCVQCFTATDCTESAPICSTDGRCVQCVGAADCPDDGIDCTYAECFANQCFQRADHSRCTEDDGNACTVNTCYPGWGCFQAELDCDDELDCTQDDCDPTTGCTHDPEDWRCTDFNECTVNTCSIGTGCSTANVANSTSCDNGAGTCQNGVCEPV